MALPKLPMLAILLVYSTIPAYADSLTASPNPCRVATASDACTSTLNWKISKLGSRKSASLRVSIDGQREIEIACGKATGQASAAWINLGSKNYRFTVYEAARCGSFASGDKAKASVDVSAALIPAPSPTPSPTPTPTPSPSPTQTPQPDRLTANPNPCLVSKETDLCTSTVSWSLPNLKAGHSAALRVSVDGNKEVEFECGGATGQSSPSWINLSSKNYHFVIYDVQSCGNPSSTDVALASVDVTAKLSASPTPSPTPSPTVSPSPTPQPSATPTPNPSPVSGLSARYEFCTVPKSSPGGACTISLLWNLTSQMPARKVPQLRVSIDGGSEVRLGCVSVQGQTDAPWLNPGKLYRFTIYAVDSCEREGIATLVATRDTWALQEMAAPSLPGIGTNSVDLAMQFIGIGNGSDKTAAFKALTRRMAIKALDDAHDLGMNYVRVAITGFGPISYNDFGDLDLYMRDPAAYWAAIDDMMNELKKRGMQIIASNFSLFQWPALAGETYTEFLDDPSSRSYRMAKEYWAEFIRRYKGTGVVRMYEIGNEANLGADFDLVRRCREEHNDARCPVIRNYTTDQLIAFNIRMAEYIRSLDSTTPVAAGLGYPSAYSMHIRRSPEWTPRGIDWTLDSVAEFKQLIADLSTGLDAVSVHYYYNSQNLGDTQRFGMDSFEFLGFSHAVASSMGKEFLLGEFGCFKESDGTRPTCGKLSERIARQNIPHSGLWTWQFYWANSYEIDDYFSLEPAANADLLGTILDANRKMGANIPVSKPSDPLTLFLSWPIAETRVPQGKPMIINALATVPKLGTMKSVTLTINGKSYGAKTAFPYQWTVNPMDFPNQRVKIEVRAESVDGRTATDSLFVTTAP